MTTKQKELIEALRSGKYKQCKNYLRKGDCYCADGVACDISGLGEWRKGFTLDNSFTYLSDSHSSCIIPADVAKMFNMGSLAGFNDRGETFEQIADMLEERWK